MVAKGGVGGVRWGAYGRVEVDMVGVGMETAAAASGEARWRGFGIGVEVHVERRWVFWRRRAI